MNLIPKRAWGEMTIASGLILLACSALVRDARRDADAVARSLESSLWELEQSKTRLAPQAIASIQSLATKRRDLMLSASKLQENESALYAHLNTLAARHAVQVEQLVPATSNTQPPAPSTSAASPAPPSIGTQSTYTMSITGPFQGVARFVRSLESDTGFCAVRSLRISPIDASPASPVRAVLITDHFGVVASLLTEGSQP